MTDYFLIKHDIRIVTQEIWLFHPDSWEIVGRTRDFNSPYLNCVVFLVKSCICSQAAFFEDHHIRPA